MPVMRSLRTELRVDLGFALEYGTDRLNKTAERRGVGLLEADGEEESDYYVYTCAGGTGAAQNLALEALGSNRVELDSAAGPCWSGPSSSPTGSRSPVQTSTHITKR